MFRLYAEKNDGQKISSWELFHLTTAFSHFLFPASEKLHRSQAVNKNHNEGPFSDLWWQENLKMCEYLVINLNVKVYLIKHHFSSFQDDDIGCVTPQCSAKETQHILCRRKICLCSPRLVEKQAKSKRCPAPPHGNWQNRKAQWGKADCIDTPFLLHKNAF